MLEPFLALCSSARGCRSPPTSTWVAPAGLRRALRTLVREGVVEEYAGGLEPVYAIAP